MSARSGTAAPEEQGRRPVQALLAAVAVVLFALTGVGGIAFAYWHASGTGTGTAITATATDVTLSPALPTATLYPGGQAEVTLTVTNPNPGVVTFGSLALDTTQGTGGFAVDAAHAGCDVSVLSVTTQTNAGAGWRVPAKTGGVDGSLAISLPNALAMGADAANACQGAQFTVYLVTGS